MTLRTLPLLFALTWLAMSASAQVVTLGSTIHDGNGGPFVAGTVYVIPINAQVPAGTTLTIQPGAIVKMGPGRQLVVNGSLLACGAPGNEVHITSLSDDSVGGDTNGDGSMTLPLPGDWNRITPSNAGTVILKDAFVDYSQGKIQNPTHNAVFLENVAFRHRGPGPGMDLGNRLAALENVLFASDVPAAPPLENVPLDAVPLFQNLGFEDSMGNDHVAHAVVPVTGTATVSGVLAIDPSNTFNGNGMIHVINQVVLGPTSDVTFQDLTMKFSGNGSIETNGAMSMTGTPGQPMTLTSIHDDVGGDTNGDGPPVGTPAGWSGIEIQNTGSANLADVELRFVDGQNSPPGVDNDGVVVATRIRICDGGGDGFRETRNGTTHLTDSHIENNGGRAAQIKAENLGNNLGVTAVGNAGGDFIAVPNRPIAFKTVRVNRDNLIGDVLVLDGDLLVDTGGELEIGPGVNIKAIAPFHQLIAQNGGKLRLRGTPGEPVKVTAFTDDAVGGDTNGDGGGTSPVPGAWGGINILATAGEVLLENVLLCYAGGQNSTVKSFAPDVTLDSIEIRESAGTGFSLGGATRVSNCVAAASAGHGFELFGGSFDVIHCTSAGNGGSGFADLGGWGGEIWNSIAHGNTGGGVNVNIQPNDVFFSNGAFPGVNGNQDVDPLFVDESGFDFRLDLPSPSIDAGDAAAGLAVEHDLLGSPAIWTRRSTSTTRQTRGPSS